MCALLKARGGKQRGRLRNTGSSLRKGGGKKIKEKEGCISVKEALSGLVTLTQSPGLGPDENGFVCWLSCSFSISLNFFSC